MKPSLLALAAAAALLASACVVSIGSGESRIGISRLRGDGIPASERRELPAFSRVELRASFDVDVQVGEPRLVEVLADSNLLERVTTEVRGQTLVVAMRRGSYSFATSPRVTIRLPALEALSLQGSGDVRIGGAQGESLELSLTGSGDIRAEGEVGRLRASLAGSGELRLGELRARDVKVVISGSGDVEVHATESLDARVTGSGDIRYRGRPATRAHVTGSGSIQAR